jgi:hypothetical protein
MAVPLATTDLGNGTILLLIALIVLPIAGIAFAGSGKAFRSLGKGPFAIEQDLPPARVPSAPVRLDRGAQEAEVRQMLEAKSYRRVQRGEAPLDIDAETKRLLDAPAPRAGAGFDAEIREEVRQLVVARNERRMRQGKPPLDVEDEINRQLTDLEGLGQ